jgi:hypothetical protein
LATAWVRPLEEAGSRRLVEEASIGEDGVLTYPDDLSFYGQKGECD